MFYLIYYYINESLLRRTSFSPLFTLQQQKNKNKILNKKKIKFFTPF